MKEIKLGAFIESVKAEILAYQKKHQGEPALFSFEEVELEATVGTTIDANGKVSVFAVQFGAETEQACTHKVRVKFRFATSGFVDPFGPTAEIIDEERPFDAV